MSIPPTMILLDEASAATQQAVKLWREEKAPASQVEPVVKQAILALQRALDNLHAHMSN